MPRHIPDSVTRVVNIRKTGCDVYIGRPSRWGNPFRVGQHGTRAEVIERYRQWILGRRDLMRALPTLKGKRLGCYCKPLACHGDVLVELVERS